MSPDSLEIEDAVGFNIGDGTRIDEGHAQRSHTIRAQHVARAIDIRRQAKKDTKSIAQNVYDSVSLIYSYSKHIPSPTAALDRLCGLKDDLRPGEHAVHANKPSVTARANGAVSIARQHSQQNLRAQSQAHAARDQPEVLSNGQQVHKVPYRQPSASGQAYSMKSTSNTSVDSATDMPKMSISKTGRKSFTLGGTIVLPLAKSNATPAQAPRLRKVEKPRSNDRGAIASASILSCDVLDQMKSEIHHGQQEQTTSINPDGLDDTYKCTQSEEAFVNRSLFYTLSDTETLLRSFRDSNDAFQQSPLPHLDSARLAHSFRDWSQRNGALIFDSLSVAVETLFNRPPELDTIPNNNSTDSASSHEPTHRPRYLNNHEAAHVVMICIHALTSSVPVGWSRSWAQLRSLRSWGVVAPNATADADAFLDPYVNIIDALEYEPAVRLADRLLRAIGARMCFEHILQTMRKETTSSEIVLTTSEDNLLTILIRHLAVVEHVALDSRRKMKSVNTTSKEPGWTVTSTFMEWLKTLIIKRSNGNIEIKKWSSVGAAVMFLHELCEFPVLMLSFLPANIDRRCPTSAKCMVSNVQDTLSARAYERR